VFVLGFRVSYGDRIAFLDGAIPVAQACLKAISIAILSNSRAATHRISLRFSNTSIEISSIFEVLRSYHPTG
jgi:hypothetical protein